MPHRDSGCIGNGSDWHRSQVGAHGDLWRTSVSASDYVLIIGAVAGGLVLCINAYGTHYGRKEAQEAAKVAVEKLDVIHDLTNSSMAALKSELAETKTQWKAALERIARLENMLEAAQMRRSTD